MIGYYPVLTNGMCLRCHGNPGRDIQAFTAALLRQEYSTDQATGYGVDELRGIFAVIMRKAATGD
jgi:hypothetical protein